MGKITSKQNYLSNHINYNEIQNAFTVFRKFNDESLDGSPNSVTFSDFQSLVRGHKATQSNFVYGAAKLLEFMMTPVPMILFCLKHSQFGSLLSEAQPLRLYFVNQFGLGSELFALPTKSVFHSQSQK
jgi:nicotinamide riboside kinase